MSNELKFKINYKDYPEYMFAIIAAYLPESEGRDLRREAGSVVFRHEDLDGWTYKNGVLHSYNDKPAIISGHRQEWYKNGKLHREGDLPAVISGDYQAWYKYGELHREGELPAFISGHYLLWYKYGKLHREGDLPAIISKYKQEWYKNGKRYIPTTKNL